MTRRQLGASADVHQLAIRQWETGHRVPTVETVGALARALKVSPLALTDRADVKTDDLTLRDLRLLAGLTQQQAAAGAGLLRTTYSCLERGETGRLSTADAASLARGFQVSLLEVQAAQAASRAEYLRREAQHPLPTAAPNGPAGPGATLFLPTGLAARGSTSTTT